MSFEDPEPRSEKIQLAGSSVKALLDACGYTQKLDEQRAITLWGECITQIFGPEAIVATSVKGVDRKELTVTVAKAAWRLIEVGWKKSSPRQWTQSVRSKSSSSRATSVRTIASIDGRGRVIKGFGVRGLRRFDFEIQPTVLHSPPPLRVFGAN